MAVSEVRPASCSTSSLSWGTLRVYETVRGDTHKTFIMIHRTAMNKKPERHGSSGDGLNWSYLLPVIYREAFLSITARSSSAISAEKSNPPSDYCFVFSHTTGMSYVDADQQGVHLLIHYPMVMPHRHRTPLAAAPQRCEVHVFRARTERDKTFSWSYRSPQRKLQITSVIVNTEIELFSRDSPNSMRGT